MTLIDFVVAVLVIGLLFWCVQTLLKAYSIGDPIRSVVLVVFALLVVLVLVGLVGGQRWVRLY